MPPLFLDRIFHGKKKPQSMQSFEQENWLSELAIDFALVAIGIGMVVADKARSVFKRPSSCERMEPR